MAIGPHRSGVILTRHFPWSTIAWRYSSQSGCSPEMERKYSTERLDRVGQVDHLGRTGHLHPRSVPLVGEDADRRGRVAAEVLHLGPLRVARDHDAALLVNAGGHRRQLRAAVGPAGRQDQAVAGSEELDEPGAVDGRGGGSGHGGDHVRTVTRLGR